MRFFIRSIFSQKPMTIFLPVLTVALADRISVCPVPLLTLGQATVSVIPVISLGIFSVFSSYAFFIT